MDATVTAPQISKEKQQLLEAILPHVPFDGWTDAAWAAALADLDLTEAEGRMIAPRGAVDLAVAYHQAGDAAMLSRAAAEDLSALRYSERVARLIRLRLDEAAIMSEETFGPVAPLTVFDTEDEQ